MPRTLIRNGTVLTLEPGSSPLTGMTFWSWTGSFAKSGWICPRPKVMTSSMLRT